jgi:hypothetical protein
VTSPTKIPQLAFNGGEISPELQGRIDLAKYGTGVNYALNFILRDYGGMERRPGLGYVASAKNASEGGRLFPFIFNDQQSYVVEMGDQYARFYMLGGSIYATTPRLFLTTLAGDRLLTLSGDPLVSLHLDPTAAPYEIATPFLFADLWRIQYAQSADVMWLTHQNYQIQTLTRSAHSSWTMADWTSDTGPFLDPNITTTTLAPSAVTVGASITLTASAALFASGHVGALFRIGEDDTNGYSMWEPAKVYGAAAVVRYGNNVYSTSAGGTSGAVAPVHDNGTRYDGQIGTACQWTFLHAGYGVVRITNVASNLSATATVLSRLPSTTAVVNWREGAFSDYRGWPAAVALSAERLWYAATPHQPQTVWGSRVGAFDDFTPGANADDAVTFTIVAREANPIRTIAERKGLYLATSRRVYRVTGTGGGPIKPDDIVVTPMTSRGSSGVQPVDVDRALLIVDQSGKRVQELGYQVEADDDAARNLNKLATHILRQGR